MSRRTHHAATDPSAPDGQFKELVDALKTAKRFPALLGKPIGLQRSSSRAEC